MKTDISKGTLYKTQIELNEKNHLTNLVKNCDKKHLVKNYVSDWTNF